MGPLLVSVVLIVGMSSSIVLTMYVVGGAASELRSLCQPPKSLSLSPQGVPHQPIKYNNQFDRQCLLLLSERL
jgi:hypothetical protein